MATRKIRNTWWVDFRFRRDRHRRRSPENSRAGAAAYETSLRQRLSKGEDISQTASKPQELTFRAFSAQWEQMYVATNNKPSEQRTKAFVLRKHLVPWFGEFVLAKVSSAQIELYKVSKLKGGLSAKSVNNHLIVLSKCLRTAVEWELLDKCPKVGNLKTISQRLEFLSPAESKRLIDAGTEPQWGEMTLLALRTGMRLGELFGLEWQDIDFQRKVISVQRSIVCGIVGTPKNHRTRHIPFTDEVGRVLFERRRATGLLFHRPDGSALSHHMAYDALHRVCDRAGIRRVSWHVMRHTFASQLACEGVPIPAIKELLGHSSIVMTMRYAHLSPSTLRDAVATLEKAQDREMNILGQQAVNTRLDLVQL